MVTFLTQRLTFGVSAAQRVIPRAFDSARSMDIRRHARVAPAADRNKDAILEVLKARLAKYELSTPDVLEVASGTGQHVAHFAAAIPDAHFQPSDMDAEGFHSIEAWSEGLPNVQPPIVIDCSGEWQGAATEPRDVVMVANMCHISPWPATAGLCRGAGKVLRPGGLLMVYGPFKVDGQCTTASNASFDASLRQQNPEWGYRDIKEVESEAVTAGLQLQEMVPMPANNFFLIFTKQK
eukprot:jgi/Ulvmu1/5844/UM025_0103.1